MGAEEFETWVKRARDRRIEEIAADRHLPLRRQGRGLVGACPKCGGDDRFAINIKKQVWLCRQCGGKGDVIAFVRHLDGCDFNAACETLTGEPPPRAKSNGHNGKDHAAPVPRKVVVERFDYTDADDERLLFQAERVEFQNPDGSFVLTKDGKRKKTFWQRRPDPDKPGEWIYNVDGVPPVPYRAAELRKAVAAGYVIQVVEGEAKADLLWQWNIPATCCAGGAEKWRPEHSAFLRGANVVILPDHDVAGRKHMDVVGASLRGIAASVRVLELPGLPPKGDVKDWAAAGHTADELCRLVETDARPWTPRDDEGRAMADDDIIRPGEPKGRQPEVLTEHTAALVFTDRYRDKLVFDHDRGRWARWTGSYWQMDNSKLAFDLAHQLAAQLADADPKHNKRSTGKASFVAGVERFAQADRAFAFNAPMWDRNLFLLGTPDGTIDLGTGVLRAPDPKDYISKITAVAPATTPSCPLWLKFLDEATGGDQPTITFLQRWCGYSLTGDTSERALVFCYGPGTNGKTVFLKTVAKILNDYATVGVMDTFTATKIAQHPTDVAKLCGARLVWVSETEEGQEWAEARIKQLTGGDVLTGRFMRQDFFDFLPTHKLTFIGNNKPRLGNVDDAIKARVNMVPFLNLPKNVDRRLFDNLRAEWPGILRWMVDGCLDWQKSGLQRSDTIKDATEEYFRDQDVFHQWLEERCDIEPGNTFKTASSGELFESWAAFAKRANHPTGTQTSFADRLKKEKVIKAKSGSTRLWRGIRLKVTEDQYGTYHR
jgi:putative DNA primase/helicase